MKLNKLTIAFIVIASAGSGLVSCSDDDMFTQDGKEAFIISADKNSSPWTIGRSGMRWYSRVSNDTIYIKVSPQYDVTTELDSVCPKFYVSKGAVVTPDPSIPVDLTVEGGVKYTVTSEDGKTSRTYVVTHSLTDFLPNGGGATLGMIVVDKTFAELGYPGEHNNFGFADSRQYGDLNGYVAFCGHDHIVLLARQYTDPHFDNPSMNVVNNDLGLRYYKASDLSYEGILNTGDINIRMMRTITSDWNGTMVAAVVNGESTDLYFWDNPASAPTKFATVDKNLASSEDGCNYLQVCGDVKATANISAAAYRSNKGEHYIIHLEGGKVVDTQTVTTGYRADDGNGFQMISPLGTDLHPEYVVGDTEGQGNNTIKGYINTNAGRTRLIMPSLLQSQGSGGFHDWWVGTGSCLARSGARRPWVSAMPINGKMYFMLLNGTGWWWCNTLIDASDFNTRIPGAEYDFSINANWSFGSSGDWYWDEATHEAYWVGWIDRQGMFLYKMTCYE